MPVLDPIALTRALLRFDTINPPGAEEPCARHAGALLEAAGFHTRYHGFGTGRASLVATLGGDPDLPPICFTGHLDVVPLGARPWTRDPFAGELADGRLYGRGSSDMKCGVAAFVTAAVALAPRLERSPGVTIVLTAGEETGCEGAFDLARTPGALGRAGAIIVAEPTGNQPLVGHKGALWLHACTTGVTAHGSTPHLGDNAVCKAARAISHLEAFRFTAPPHPVMGAATLNVGTVRGGLNINSVPDQAVIGVDIRTVPTRAHGELRADLARALGPGTRLDTVLDLAPVYTDPDTEWVQRVFDLMTPHLGERPRPRVDTAFTDAAALTPAFGGPPTLILGPGEMHLAHQTDEYCVVERVRTAVEAFTDIMRDWCGL